MSELIDALTYLYGPPPVTGALKSTPEDFLVEETLSFTPSGEGEHLFLWVEKTNTNTEWLARQLANHFKVATGAVSWAGLKDRVAVTRQWFGVHLPGHKGEPVMPDIPNVKILDWTRNNRKLRVGAISHNSFRLYVRDLGGDLASLQSRCAQVAESGAPNYFGEQRFGRDGGNIAKAERWLLEGGKIRRQDKAIVLSAARSLLFNHVLSARISAGLWDKVLPGDVLMLDGTKSVFSALENELDVLKARLVQGDCHLSCPLPGKGRDQVSAEAAEWESRQLSELEPWLRALERERVESARRAARVIPRNMSWQLEGNCLELSFQLPPGSYATAVLRELVVC